MAEPFLSEIRIMSFGYAPRGWAQCNGQFLPINQNQALFALLGTTYGGNGQTTFALPNLQGKIPIHTGFGYNLGQTGGETAHVLTQSEMAPHNHPVFARNDNSGINTLRNNTWAPNTWAAFSGSQNGSMNPAIVANTGGGQAHENMPPFLALNFCIALQGIFPSQN